MEMHWGSEPITFIPACKKRDGIFELIPTDVIQVLRLGSLRSSKDAIREIGDKLIVPTAVGLAVVTEMAWFAQHTRTVDAYDTHGSVDKYGIEVSAENFRKHCWTETSYWINVLLQIGERYSLSQDDVEELRVASCQLFGRRRLGQRQTPFPVVLASSLEMRAIWIDIAYQKPTFSNISPFAPDADQTLNPKQIVCLSCKKVCRHKCSKCKLVAYCNKECQKKDFKKHKKVCTAIKQVTLLQEIYAKKRGVKYSLPDNIDYYLIGF